MNITEYAMFRALSEGESGGGIQYEDSETLNLDVGVDAEAFFTFASEHLMSDGWRIDVVGPNIGAYPLVRLAMGKGGGGGGGGSTSNSVFIITMSYSSNSAGNTLAYCSFEGSTSVIKNIDNGRKGLTYLRAYKVN